MSENILNNIIAKKVERVDALKKSISLDSLNEIIKKNNTFINFKEKIQNNIIQDKISIIVGLTDDLVNAYDARDLIKLTFEHLGSKGGGGRVDFAQAGGDQKEHINQAFLSIKAKI